MSRNPTAHLNGMAETKAARSLTPTTPTLPQANHANEMQEPRREQGHQNLSLNG